jgi:putative methyltransferase (TIGR04325 family)
MKLPSLKQFVPPLIASLYQNYRNGLAGLYVWKGVYSSFNLVKEKGLGYMGERLAKQTEVDTRFLLEDLKQPKRIPYQINEENSLLPLISVILARSKGKLTVLDLGGGMGVGFVSLITCTVGMENIDYHVIETAAMCDGGSSVFVNDKRIRFWKGFPDSLPGLDIVFINSALQYFENYKETLTRLSSYRPEYIFFVKLSAGDIPTYATAQRNLGGAISAYWFLNVEEIVELMASTGYDLIYKSALSRIYNQDNFEPKYRMNKACNLLFARRQDTTR